jgi:uncharacterized membrane protein YbhN (UPF0104 family)
MGFSSMATDPVRAEHDAVLSSLSTRESTRHFAHAAVSILLAIALMGTAGKLWWDFSTTNPEWAQGFVAVGAAALLYAAVRLFFGFRANVLERVKLVRLRELRLQLGVDAPASLTQQVP